MKELNERVKKTQRKGPQLIKVKNAKTELRNYKSQMFGN